MVDHVEFNEPKISTAAFVEGRNNGGLENRAASFVRSLFGGLIQNDNQARYVVFAIVLVFLIVSFYYLLQSFSPSEMKEILKSIHA